MNKETEQRNSVTFVGTNQKAFEVQVCFSRTKFSKRERFTQVLLARDEHVARAAVEGRLNDEKVLTIHGIHVGELSDFNSK